MSEQEVVRTQISQDRIGRLAVGTQNVDQSVGKFGKLRSAANARRALVSVDAAAQRTHDGVKTRSCTAQNACQVTTNEQTIAQFAITINSNVCPHIRVPNMLMRNPMHDVIGIFNSEAHY